MQAKKRDTRRISGYRIRIDDCCSASNNCDGRPCSLRHRLPRISESYLSQTALTTTTHSDIFHAAKILTQHVNITALRSSHNIPCAAVSRRPSAHGGRRRDPSCRSIVEDDDVEDDVLAFKLPLSLCLSAASQLSN